MVEDLGLTAARLANQLLAQEGQDGVADFLQLIRNLGLRASERHATWHPKDILGS